jgi:hypothetical protein
MLLEADGGGDVLVGHLARGNPQRDHDAEEALVIFRGPNARRRGADSGSDIALAAQAADTYYEAGSWSSSQTPDRPAPD